LLARRQHDFSVRGTGRPVIDLDPAFDHGHLDPAVHVLDVVDGPERRGRAISRPHDEGSGRIGRDFEPGFALREIETSTVRTEVRVERAAAAEIDGRAVVPLDGADFADRANHPAADFIGPLPAGWGCLRLGSNFRQ
jgi:hypothetical protein